MPLTNGLRAFRQRIAGVRDRMTAVRSSLQRTLFWRVWDRMLEIEFVDRSVALAGKAFVSFFPLIIVVASFMPPNVRASIFRQLTHSLGIEGNALVTAKQAFASSDDVRKATGILGLVLTIFFATSFTTALQRVYLRAWRRPHTKAAGQYLRGSVWFLVILWEMAVFGALRALVGDGPQYILFAVLALAGVCALWWFTAWFMLTGQVRWRVLLPTGLITGAALGAYGDHLDARDGHAEREPVRLLRGGARPCHVVLRRRHLRSRGSVCWCRVRRGHGQGRCAHPWPRALVARPRSRTIIPSACGRAPARRRVPTDRRRTGRFEALTSGSLTHR
jgi:hypothetical protein